MTSALEKAKKTRCGVFLEVVTTSTITLGVPSTLGLCGRYGPALTIAVDGVLFR